jgi:acetyl-CoA acetyltransferase
MVKIIGASVTSFGPRPDQSITSMAIEAGLSAMRDANADYADVGAGFFSNALGAKLFGDMTIGQNVFAELGLIRIPVVNTENACTSGSTAFYLAQLCIAAGQSDLALVIGSEKMCVPQMGLIDSGANELETLLGMVTPAGFAMRAQRHMHEYGTTPEQMAAVTVKSRQHAALNPLAQFRKPETLSMVLDSPMIADPLTRSQCCPIADGAAALLLASDDYAAGLDRTVRLDAAVLSSGSYENGADIGRWETDSRTAALAYEQAGIGPEELDLVECHDAFTIAEIVHYEGLGLCGPGEGGALVESGATSLGGRIPVNVSGGLLSRGHPVAATGIAQIAELVLQLRQEAGSRQVENCRTGLAHCMGGDRKGDTKSCTVVVLSR